MSAYRTTDTSFRRSNPWDMPVTEKRMHAPNERDLTQHRQPSHPCLLFLFLAIQALCVSECPEMGSLALTPSLSSQKACPLDSGLQKPHGFYVCFSDVIWNQDWSNFKIRTNTNNHSGLEVLLTHRWCSDYPFSRALHTSPYQSLPFSSPPSLLPFGTQQPEEWRAGSKEVSSDPLSY